MTKVEKSYQYTAYYGLGMKLISGFILAFGILMFCLVPFAGINECRQEDQRWIAALMGSIFTGFGFWNLLGCFVSSISWNGEYITYRTMIGKRVHTSLSSLSEAGYIPIVDVNYVKFDESPVMLFSPYMKGYNALTNKVEKHLVKKFPHRFYVPAFREAFDESDEAACMLCESLFSIDEIIDWKRVDNRIETEDDLAICPICNSDEAVICNLSDVQITVEGIRSFNSEIEATLNDAEVSRRQTLRQKINV